MCRSTLLVGFRQPAVDTRRWRRPARNTYVTAVGMTVGASREPATWRILMGYVRPHRWTLAAGGGLSLVTAATGLALPLVARSLIQGLGAHDPVRGAVLLMSG